MLHPENFFAGRYGSYNGKATDLTTALQGLVADGVLEVDPKIIAGALSGKLAEALDEVTGRNLLPELQDQIRAEQQLAQAYSNANAAITAHIDALKLDPSLSPLLPADKLAEARGQFAAAVMAAKSGDLDALGRVPQLAQAVLTAGRGYYTSSPQYQSLFEATTATESELAGIAGTKADAANAQAVHLSSVVDAINNGRLVESVAGVRSEIENLRQEIRALAARR